jgi:Holliday junction resolvase RusA-like endonuclease
VAEPYVIIELPWPVDASGRTRATGKGRPKFSTRGGFVRAFTPAKTRAFENQIKDAAIAAMSVMGLQPLNEAIGLEVSAFMPIPESWSAKKKAAALAGDIACTTKPDWENIAKLTDGMNHHPPRFRGDKEKRPIIWGDDAHVVSGHVMKIYSDRPRLVFTIYRWFA